MNSKTQLPIPTEYEESVKLAQYLELNKYLFTKTAQETYTTSWQQRTRNKKSGVRKGFPDFVIVKNGRVIFIELKRQRGGQVSPEQRIWIDVLNACDGVEAYICRGADEAIERLEVI